MKPLLSLYKVTKYSSKGKFPFNYISKKRILNKISFTVYENEIISLVGESKNGKTLLAELLVGLSKTDSGNIYYKNKKLYDYDDAEIRKKLQIVFHAPEEILNLKMTAYQLIAEPLIFHKIYKEKSELNKRVSALAKEVFFNERYLNVSAEDLNKTDLKKILFARSLSLNPEFIVIDDILSRLDELNLNFFKNLILKIKKQRNLTLMLISNNLNLISDISDRFAIMYKGNLLEIINKEMFDKLKKTQKEVKLHPYTSLLFTDIKKIENIETYKNMIGVKRKEKIGRCVFLDRCNEVIDACHKKKPVFLETDEGHFVSCLLYDEEMSKVSDKDEK